MTVQPFRNFCDLNFSRNYAVLVIYFNRQPRMFDTISIGVRKLSCNFLCTDLTTTDISRKNKIQLSVSLFYLVFLLNLVEMKAGVL